MEKRSNSEFSIFFSRFYTLTIFFEIFFQPQFQMKEKYTVFLPSKHILKINVKFYKNSIAIATANLS